MKALLLAVVLGGATLSAQADPFEGLWKGYDGEWGHVSRQLIALAEAIPSEKFAWRPAPGVRSTSEVLMHTTLANFYLLSVTGPKMPADLQRKVKIDGRDATVDGMYLRIIVHANEHMGQLVAYARMNGIVPPWLEGSAK